MIIKDALNQTTIDPLDAECLLAHCLQQTRAYLFTHPDEQLDIATQHAFETYINQRKQGIPLAYLTGYKEFWSLPLQVNQHTLIPRPETELLVETALQCLDPNKPLHIADLGTGSGAIALALAYERPNFIITATDHCPHALTIAQKNATQLGLILHTRKGHWFEALPTEKRYDAIISNPPYIDPTDPHLEQLQHEPHTALVSDENGFADLHHIICHAKHHLHPHACLILEHGYQQADAVKQLMMRYNYTSIQHLPDLLGHQRVTIAKNRPFSSHF